MLGVLCNWVNHKSMYRSCALERLITSIASWTCEISVRFEVEIFCWIANWSQCTCMKPIIFVIIFSFCLRSWTIFKFADQLSFWHRYIFTVTQACSFISKKSQSETHCESKKCTTKIFLITSSKTDVREKTLFLTLTVIDEQQYNC